MSFELNTEPGPPDPDREERRGMWLAVLVCFVFYGLLMAWLICRS